MYKRFMIVGFGPPRNYIIVDVNFVDINSPETKDKRRITVQPFNSTTMVYFNVIYPLVDLIFISLPGGSLRLEAGEYHYIGVTRMDDPLLVYPA